LLDRYDRPLQRRKHASEIHTARIGISNATRDIKDAHKTIDKADRRIVTLNADLAAAKAVLADRAPLDTTLADIDRQLGDDPRIRTRIISLEQPDHIVDIIGKRPGPGMAAREWDHAAGQLDQLLDAYDNPGIGTDTIDRATIVERRRQIERIIQPYQHHVHEREAPEIDFGLSL
jgi:hypothetical protein